MTEQTPDWDEVLAYRCRSCKENQIEPIDSTAARSRECRHCVGVAVLEAADD